MVFRRFICIYHEFFVPLHCQPEEGSKGPGEGKFTSRPAKNCSLPSAQKRTTEGRRKGKKTPIEKKVKRTYKQMFN
jgi:hypothetical protein